MPRDFNGSSDTAFTVGSVSAYPVSVSIWFRPDAVAEMGLISLTDADVAGHYLLLKLDTSINDRVAMEASDGSGSVLTNTTSDFSASSWQHAAAVFTSATDRAVYYQGGNKGTSATSRSPSGESHTTTGYLRTNSTSTIFFNGHLAHSAVWNVALSDGEIAALANGWSPLSVQPQSLWAYWPLDGWIHPGETRDYSGNGRNLTITSSGHSVPEHQLLTPRGPILATM